MFPLIKVYYYGEVNIAYWEWVLAALFVFMIYVYFAREKSIMIKKAPEYQYYLWGLMAKLFGGVVFSLIYFYYYAGGDTIGYFFSAIALRNMAVENPMEYFSQMLGDNSMMAWTKYSLRTGKPLQYLYFDDRTFVVIRLVSIFTFLTFKSYLITTLVIASLSFFGPWACYRTFVSYYPQLYRKLATAFLFMPSAIFWGSAILKDTFTFSAVCWWVHAVDEVFFKRRNISKNYLIIGVSGLLLIVIKPYIFMVLFPASVLWLLYFRVVRMRNLLFRFVLLPIAVVVMVGVSVLVLSRLGNMLDKFALDEALQTIQVTQSDLSNAKAYGHNSFNIGEFDGTWFGVVSKFPIAVNAALFRPYLWESKSVVMAMSGAENLWVLAITVVALFRAGPRFFLRCMAGVPLLLMTTTFSILFAFTVGVTTPNFGALVRFKIPMVPFFISTMYVIVYLSRIKWALEDQRLPFDLREFRMGTGHVKNIVELIRDRRRSKSKRRMGTAG
ncbi:MAG: hypothetical protein JNM62_05740 [Flavobacteriales bacterium]|nr:hypothetical protein [Flavobacteriales bacterium]